MEHRFALLEERSYLVGLEVERLALDASREQHRADDPKQEADPGRDEDDRQVGAELGADLPFEETDRDETDDPAVLLDRHFRAYGLAE
jgi:hypothetical protein